MDWCSAYLTPQALPKYIYFSPPLIFPTTSTEKNTPYESLQALLRYVEWELEQKRTEASEGYIIVSMYTVKSVWSIVRLSL